MNAAQKFAWANLAIIGVVIILSVMVSALFGSGRGVPLIGLLGLLGISSSVFQKKRRKGGVFFDERDQLICQRSLDVAYSVFWPVFAAACMIPFFIIGPSGSIPVVVLPMMLGGIGITLTLVQSVAILIQYGRRNKNHE